MSVPRQSSDKSSDELDDRFAHRAAIARSQATREQGRRQLWHAHHWPEDYGERCVHLAGRPWCRRCLALYPLGFLVAVLSVAGLAPWPATADPAAIWLLAIPATVAFVGEAVGLFDYRARWQTVTTLLAALAFGRALGYELDQRWHPWFWQPLAVFGGIWFLASVYQHRFATER
jgi:hypothetical protein